MSKQSPLKRQEIKEALRFNRRGIKSIALFSAIINLLMLVPSIYMLQVYDRVLASGNGITLLMLTLMAIALLALMGGMEYVRSLIVIHLGRRFDALLGGRVHQASFERGLATGQANATQAFSDLDSLRQFITGNAIFAFFDAPWFPIYLLLLFLFSPWLGLLATAGAVILMLLGWANERCSRTLLGDAGKLSVHANLTAEGHLRNAESIEAMGMIRRLFVRWRDIHSGYVQRQALASERTALITACSKVVRIGLQSGLLGLGALLTLEGQLSPGMMIAGSILGGRVLAPIDLVINAWRQWAGARLSYQRLQQLLDTHDVREKATPLPNPEGELRFEGVTVVPPTSQQVALGNVSFTLPAGTILGVIGASGSGKSTLARAAVGVWKPRSGKVRIDGADLAQWDRERLGEFIGYLPQDVELFEGTVGENISRFAEIEGVQEETAANVVAAARLAGAHELILGLPQGYDTRVGVGGVGLSGGQRQRIALARALYGKPRLVVLDEPNASLDDAGDKALGECLKRLRQEGISVIVVTHRPNILAFSHRIAVLAGGQLQALDDTSKIMAQLSQARQGGKSSGRQQVAGAPGASQAGAQPPTQSSAQPQSPSAPSSPHKGQPAGSGKPGNSFQASPYRVGSFSAGGGPARPSTKAHPEQPTNGEDNNEQD